MDYKESNIGLFQVLGYFFSFSYTGFLLNGEKNGKSEKQNITKILAYYQICKGLKMKGMVLNYL